MIASKHTDAVIADFGTSPQLHVVVRLNRSRKCDVSGLDELTKRIRTSTTDMVRSDGIYLKRGNNG